MQVVQFCLLRFSEDVSRFEPTYGGGPGVVTHFLVEHFTAAHFVRHRRTRCSSCSREDCACSVVLRFLRSCRSRSQRPPTYPSPMCSDTHVLAWRAKRQLVGAAELELSCFRERALVLGQLVDPTYHEHPLRTDTLSIDRGAFLLSHPLSPPHGRLAISGLLQPPRGAG